jgi:hypothetical protein
LRLGVAFTFSPDNGTGSHILILQPFDHIALNTQLGKLPDRQQNCQQSHTRYLFDNQTAALHTVEATSDIGLVKVFVYCQFIFHFEDDFLTDHGTESNPFLCLLFSLLLLLCVLLLFGLLRFVLKQDVVVQAQFE